VSTPWGPPYHDGARDENERVWRREMSQKVGEVRDILRQVSITLHANWPTRVVEPEPEKPREWVLLQDADGSLHCTRCPMIDEKHMSTARVREVLE
jgi:hypothetical protein